MSVEEAQAALAAAVVEWNAAAAARTVARNAWDAATERVNHADSALFLAHHALAKAYAPQLDLSAS